MDIKEIRLRDENTGVISAPFSLIPKGEEVVFDDKETLLAKLTKINADLKNKALIEHKHNVLDITNFPKNISSFLNDLEYVTKNDIKDSTHTHPNILILNSINQNLFDSFANKYTKTETDNKFQNFSATLKTSYAGIIHKHSISDLSDYKEPSIPIKVSQLTNDSGYLNKTDLDNLGLGSSVYSHTHLNMVSLDKINQNLLDNFADKYTKSEMDIKLKTITDSLSSSFDITTLNETIANKAEKVHNHSIIDVNGLQSTLDSKAPINHNHTIYNVNGLQSALDSKALSVHTHKVTDIMDIYSIEEIDSLLAEINSTLVTKVDTNTKISGLLKFDSNDINTYAGISGTCSGNDYWRVIGVSPEVIDNGYIEIATADNGDDPIVVRQYSGVFETIIRTLTLLDKTGDTHIPGNLYLGDKILSDYIDERIKALAVLK